MTVVDAAALARELLAAHASCTPLPPPTSRFGAAFDMTAAYAVEAEVARIRRADGHRTVGRKVGYANKAMWRILKLETLVWAHMYDDTVRQTGNGPAALSLAGRCSPRIEPEIVFALRRPLDSPPADGAAALDAVEWMALGFEINDCVFPEWKFQPADFVAAFGLHTALVVGEPVPLTPANLPAVAEQLSRFVLRLEKDGQVVEEGSGKNALRSPALCLAELARLAASQPGTAPLAEGEIISTGTLTTPQPIATGESWSAEVDGLELPALSVRF